MEYVGSKNIKKICSFYVNDMHLSVMLLPYISRQIDKDVEITTIFEKIEKQNIKIVLEKLNIKNKDKIMGIEGINSNVNNSYEIKKVIEEKLQDKKELDIIIAGNMEFVLRNSKELEDVLIKTKDNENDKIVKIIGCYNVEECGESIKDIVCEYDEILNTSGKIKINRLTMVNNN